MLIASLSWVIIGLVTGFITSIEMKTSGYKHIGDIIVGIVGGLIGGFIMNALSLSTGSSIIYSIIGACIGACILLAILHVILHNIRRDNLLIFPSKHS